MNSLVRILRYIAFPLVFLLSLILCGKILAPIIDFFYSLIENFSSLFTSYSPSFLWEFVIEPASISGICAYLSILLALLVYPGDNSKIPIVICSSILIVILIFYVFFINAGFNILLELSPNESFEDISKPRLYISAFSMLVGYSYAVYKLLSETDS